MTYKNLTLKSISIPRYDKGVWAMIIIRLFSSLGFATFGPYLMLYLNQQRHLNLSLAGLILALSTVSGAVTQILGGAYTDRFGRRKTLILFFSIGLILNFILTVMIATNVSIWLFAVVYIFSGFIFGMTQPAQMAVITDLTPKDRLTEAYAVSQLIMNAGWIFGPIAGGLMFSHLPFTYLFGTSIIMSTVCLILAVGFLPESFGGAKGKSSSSGSFNFVRDKALIIYTFLALVVFILYVQITGIYSVFAVEHLKFTTTQYGLLLMINGILAVTLQYPVTRMVLTRLGDKKALFHGSILFTISYLAMSWIPNFSLTVAAIVVFTLAELLFVPSLTSIIGKLAGPEERGRYLGLLGTGMGLGIAIAPLLGGLLYDASHGIPLLLWGPLSSIAFFAGLGFLRWFSVYRERIK